MKDLIGTELTRIRKIAEQCNDEVLLYFIDMAILQTKEQPYVVDDKLLMEAVNWLQQCRNSDIILARKTRRERAGKPLTTIGGGRQKFPGDVIR